MEGVGFFVKGRNAVLSHVPQQWHCYDLKRAELQQPSFYVWDVGLCGAFGGRLVEGGSVVFNLTRDCTAVTCSVH